MAGKKKEPSEALKKLGAKAIAAVERAIALTDEMAQDAEDEGMVGLADGYAELSAALQDAFNELDCKDDFEYGEEKEKEGG